MSRRLAVATALLCVGAGITGGGGLSGGAGLGGPEFIAFADSSYGAGATLAADNLTSRMPKWRPIAEPAFSSEDTTLKATTTCNDETSVGDPTSTRDDIADRIAIACVNDTYPKTRIWLPNCRFETLVDTTLSSSPVFTVPTNCNGVELKGQANTEMVIEPAVADYYATPRANYKPKAFDIPNDTGPAIATCAATPGAMGSRVVTLAASCNLKATGDDEWSPQSIVKLTTDRFSNQALEGQHARFYRISCVDGDQAGDKTGTDCGLLSGDHEDGGLGDSGSGATGRVVLDWPLQVDYSGALYQFNITNVQLALWERHDEGNATRNTDNMSEGFWVNGLKLDLSAFKGATDSLEGVFRFGNCFECGLINSRIPQSGTAVGVNGVAGSPARTLIAHNSLAGPAMKAVCVAEVTAVGNAQPVTVSIETTGVSACSTTSLGDSVLYISNGVSEPSLRDRFVRVTAKTGGDPSTYTLSTTQVLQSECGVAFGAPSPTGTCSTIGGGYVALLDDFGAAMIYNNASADLQVVDNVFDDPRGLGQLQNGTQAAVWAYNWARVPSDRNWWRGPFKHGDGNSSATLLEGNDIPGFTYRASSSLAPGEGVHNTFFRNRFFSQGTNTSFDGRSSYLDLWARGKMECDENDDLENGLSPVTRGGQGIATTEYSHLIANSLKFGCNVSGLGGWDWWDADGGNAHGDGTGTAGGPGEPGQWHAYSSKNLHYSGMNADLMYRSDNTTTLNRDSKDVGGGLNVYGLGHDLDEADVAPGAWAGWKLPSSLLYDDPADRVGWVDGKPPWACHENAPIGSWIGALLDDMTGGGAGSNRKLPAQLRYEGACTPLVAGYGPP